MQQAYNSLDLEGLAKVACELASVLKLGDFVLMKGDLGAGKTTFVGYLINALTGSETYVTSPTFNIMQSYECARAPIWHLDLYRLKDIKELLQIGFDPYDDTRITIIEWPQLVENIIPSYYELNISVNQDNTRSVEISLY